MMTRNKAIAVCRVSTPEQKLNNSLNRQEDSVKKAADSLGVTIERIWSGDASSKVGLNVKRKDLNEALEYTRKNKEIAYLIVDEVDRFMRSIKEIFYWIVEFEKHNVKVYFASNPELNDDNARSRLLLSLDGFKAEGSNEERQKKSVNGHKKAVSEGRYTFPTKPGYIKSNTPGVPDPHPKLFEPLQKSFKMLASGVSTPSEALKWLNNSSFTKYHAPWRMDKFSKFAQDPYYARIIRVGKQIDTENIAGLHKPMISRKEHEAIIELLSGRPKPRAKKMYYNPEFPLNKILLCSDCDLKQKFTGSIQNNGYNRKKTTYYYKYHCRGCGKSYHRKDVHERISKRFEQIRFDNEHRSPLEAALREVWSQRQKDTYNLIKQLKQHIEGLEKQKSKLVLALAESDESIRQDIKIEIENIKAKIEFKKDEIYKLGKVDDDLPEFINFGINYSDHLVEDWWRLDHETRVQCQLLLFPGGISYNSAKKVGTNNLSPIYRLKPNKKDLSITEKSLLVELAGNAPASNG